MTKSVHKEVADRPKEHDWTWQLEKRRRKTNLENDGRKISFYMKLKWTFPYDITQHIRQNSLHWLPTVVHMSVRSTAGYVQILLQLGRRVQLANWKSVYIMTLSNEDGESLFNLVMVCYSCSTNLDEGMIEARIKYRILQFYCVAL